MVLEQDDVELEYRTMRIGTCKAFPAMEDGFKGPLMMNKDGFSATMSKTQDGSPPTYNMKMPAKRIKKIEAFMGRGCPVLWVTPDEKLAETIRNEFGLDNPDGIYLDPDEERNLAERRIGIISAVDPIPFATVQSLKAIFKEIAQKSGVPYDQFFVEITHRACNDTLVATTQYMDKVEQSLKRQKAKNGKRAAEPPTKKPAKATKKRKTKRKVANSDSE